MNVLSVKYVVRSKGCEYHVHFHDEGNKLWSAYAVDVDNDGDPFDLGASRNLRPSQSMATSIARQAVKWWKYRRRDNE